MKKMKMEVHFIANLVCQVCRGRTNEGEAMTQIEDNTWLCDNCIKQMAEVRGLLGPVIKAENMEITFAQPTAPKWSLKEIAIVVRELYGQMGMTTTAIGGDELYHACPPSGLDDDDPQWAGYARCIRADAKTYKGIDQDELALVQAIDFIVSTVCDPVVGGVYEYKPEDDTPCPRPPYPISKAGADFIEQALLDAMMENDGKAFPLIAGERSAHVTGTPASKDAQATITKVHPDLPPDTNIQEMFVHEYGHWLFNAQVGDLVDFKNNIVLPEHDLADGTETHQVVTRNEHKDGVWLRFERVTE